MYELTIALNVLWIVLYLVAVQIVFRITGA
jgi:hypothetical protein